LVDIPDKKIVAIFLHNFKHLLSIHSSDAGGEISQLLDAMLDVFVGRNWRVCIQQTVRYRQEPGPIGYNVPFELLA